MCTDGEKYEKPTMFILLAIPSLCKGLTFLANPSAILILGGDDI